jgi:hypothetical protein
MVTRKVSRRGWTSGQNSEVHFLTSNAQIANLRRQLITMYKMVRDIPVPSQDVTNQTLSGRELLNYSRPGRVLLVISRLGTEKSLTFFYSVHLRLNTLE